MYCTTLHRHRNTCLSSRLIPRKKKSTYTNDIGGKGNHASRGQTQDLIAALPSSDEKAQRPSRQSTLWVKCNAFAPGHEGCSEIAPDSQATIQHSDRSDTNKICGNYDLAIWASAFFYPAVICLLLSSRPRVRCGENGKSCILLEVGQQRKHR